MRQAAGVGWACAGKGVVWSEAMVLATLDLRAGEGVK